MAGRSGIGVPLTLATSATAKTPMLPLLSLQAVDSDHPATPAGTLIFQVLSGSAGLDVDTSFGTLTAGAVSSRTLGVVGTTHSIVVSVTDGLGCAAPPP